MRKVKVKEKSEKSFDSFFENEILDENNSLSFTKNSNLSSLESAENFTNKTNPFLNFLKQIFLFLPGTFLLYLLGFIGTTVLINIFLKPPIPPSESSQISMFGITTAPFQVILLSMVGFLGIFMTWFGLGDIKNKKHLSIPASIIITGVIIAAFFKAVEVLFGGAFIEEFDKYFIYLLPLVLIVPIMMKGWTDKK